MKKVLKKDVIALAESMGYSAASKWNRPRMVEKIKAMVATASEEEVEVENSKLKKLLNVLVEEEGEVEVVEELEEETETEVEAETGVEEEVEEEEELTEAEAMERAEAKKINDEINKKAPKTKKEKREKKEKKEKKDKAGRDKFGCKEGSQAAKINACVTSTPVTIDEIVELSGQSKTRVNGHVKFLIIKGFAEKTEKGIVEVKKEG